MKAVIVVVLLAVVIKEISGFCFAEAPKVEILLSGKVRRFCEVSNPTSPTAPGKKKVKLDTGSEFISNCIRCTCKDSGLTCCGTGFFVGVIAPPPGCKVVQDGCEAVLIRMCDATKPFPS